MCTVDRLLAEVKKLSDFPVIFCGEGVTLWREQITATFGMKAQVVWPTPAARIWALAEIAQERLLNGETGDLTTLQPEYLRMPSIGVPKQRGRVPQQGRATRGTAR